MIKIFIETGNKKTSEYLFVSTLATRVYQQGDFEIVCVDGKDNLWNSTNINLLQKNILEGGKNLVIFDADGENNGGGYEMRKREIEDKKNELGLEFDLFLFPNNREDGDFETLLEHCINSEHKVVLECFSKFEQCVKSNEGEHHYNTPNRKDRMFTYGQIVGGNKLMWMFDNEYIWNLEDPYIEPLMDFLRSGLD